MNGITQSLAQHLNRQLFIRLMMVFAFCFTLMLTGFGAVASESDTCTDAPIFQRDFDPSGQGVLARISKLVEDELENASAALYQDIIDNAAFQAALKAALGLFIAFYGLFVMIGLINVAAGDLLMRLFKIGFILAVTSATGWSFFQTYIYDFFTGGTNDLINTMTEIMLTPLIGSAAATVNNAHPLSVLDGALNLGFSAKMFTTIMGVFLTGPYGLVFGIMLVFGLIEFIKALVNAVWIYLMSMIAKTLLFGIAPIFLSFMLFQKTRYLFDGWLSQLISFSLQPVFLFAFLGFYALLMEASIKEILKGELCWVPWINIPGTPFEIHWWRFKVNNEVYNGAWSWFGPDGGGGPYFPIPIVDLLIFILLCQLSWRYGRFCMQISRSIAGSSLNLDELTGALRNSFANTQQRLQQAGNAAIHGHETSQGVHGVGGIKGAMEQFRQSGKRK
jgi:type IV secretory pathway VirB6-like protein